MVDTVLQKQPDRNLDAERELLRTVTSTQWEGFTASPATLDLVRGDLRRQIEGGEFASDLKAALENRGKDKPEHA